jgi:hypothetical protein
VLVPVRVTATTQQVIVSDVETVCTEVSEITEMLIGAVIDGSYVTSRPPNIFASRLIYLLQI